MIPANALFAKRLQSTFRSCFVFRGARALEFSAHVFFAKWFRKNGTPYFFLFQKNLTVTNIQYAELVSLISLHARQKGSSQPEKPLHFIVVSDFIKGLQEVVDDLAKSNPSRRVLCDTFYKLYGDVLRRMVLLDVFNGSCTVFFPPHMELDLFKVCGESGYIHSCGRSVYARELSIAEAEDFKKAISAYIKRVSRGNKTFFVVYSHEDFTRYDRAHASSLRGGLDEVKIHVEKYYLGKKSLIRVLREIQKEHADKIVLADPVDYNRHRKQIEEARLPGDHTMWLIVDRAHPGDGRFIICYDQQYKNSNPLHLFDENKPAWIAHTTLPHTLCGAMLNVTRGLWPKGGVAIYDPFCGTGTTAFEALKFPSARVSCNDKAALARLLLLDNLDFFSSSKEDLGEIRTLLEKLSNQTDSLYSRQPNSHKQSSGYDLALSLIDDLHERNLLQNTDQWFDIPPNIVKQLARTNFTQRLYFYLALRTELRHVTALERGSAQWLKAYCEEANTLLFQTKKLCDLREERVKRSVGKIMLLSGTYSDRCTISAKAFAVDIDSSSRLTLTGEDARTRPKKKFDVIVTDPPYGFNNEVSTIALADLLTGMLDVFFDSIKPRAQMVIALPDQSHSGRRIPRFATRIWVTEQILSKAEEHGFEAVVPASILPRYGGLFQPPYYWNSEKALKRIILHFQFRKKRRPGNGSP